MIAVFCSRSASNAWALGVGWVWSVKKLVLTWIFVQPFLLRSRRYRPTGARPGRTRSESENKTCANPNPPKTKFLTTQDKAHPDKNISSTKMLHTPLGASRMAVDLFTPAELSMSHKPKVLIQLDTDEKGSVFDAVVAVDAGVDHLLQYSGVNAESVRALVHGAMYTRGPEDLHHTAIFVGGSNVGHGESLANAVLETMQDPFRVSVMLDSNGCNSTAAAAVLSARKHIDLAASTSVVLAATGPVGQRICRILANQGGIVFVVSRSLDRSQEVIDELVRADVESARLIPIASSDEESLLSALKISTAVFGCGAAGIRLLTAEQLDAAKELKVAIDLNAVPPAGIDGIEIFDKGVRRGDRIDYGALGIGGLKMKIHKASIAALFESNRRFIDCQEMLTIGSDILAR